MIQVYTMAVRFSPSRLAFLGFSAILCYYSSSIMHAYQELEYRDWALIREDSTLLSAVEGIITAGRMLHQGLENGMGSKNPQGYRAQSERLVAEAIAKHNPDLFIGKTINQGSDHRRGRVWLANGIDGIANYQNGLGPCDVAVVQTENGVLIRSVVYDFRDGELFYAARGEGSFLNGNRLVIADPAMTADTLVSFAVLFPRPDHKIEDEKLVSSVSSLREALVSQYHIVTREYQAGNLELYWIAANRMHGYCSSWTTRTNLGPGVLGVLEAGGHATHNDGTVYFPGNRGVLGASPTVYNVMYSYLPKDL